VQEVGAHQPALILSEGRMTTKSGAHLVRPRLEGLDQIAVPPPKVIQDIRQLAADGCRIQRQNAVHDVIGTCPIS